MPPSARDESSFGFADVSLADKQGLVDDVFRRVARRYDLMNVLMSGGLHRAWKNAMVAALNPPRRRPFAVVDVAGGTGDVALRILGAGGRGTTVTVLDINGDMLRVGRERAGDRFGDRLVFVQVNPEATRPTTAIPTPSASATCRGSQLRLPRPIVCCGGAGASCASNSPR
jgi:demethylmenaquinone methyltransferase/2-methoxy-6-polyprenyl-1,4-benzoquinol methylase